MSDAKDLAEKVYKQTMATHGATMNLGGEEPTDGFMVGGFGPEVTVSVEDFNVGDVESYIAWNRIELEAPGRYLGTWISDGKVYLDVSQNYRLLSDALIIGGHKNQLAVWAVALGQEIKL